MFCGLVFSMPVVPWMRSRIENLRGAPKAVSELLWMAGLFALFLLSVASLTSGSYNPFIYFRF
jgi:hypothetical protein